MAGLLDGIREWQFQQNDQNFWRQATPALKDQLNPSPQSTKLQEIARDNQRNAESETRFACKTVARDPTRYQAYRDLVQRNHRGLEAKYKVQVQLLAPIPSLREIQGFCARHPLNKT